MVVEQAGRIGAHERPRERPCTQVVKRAAAEAVSRWFGGEMAHHVEARQGGRYCTLALEAVVVLHVVLVAVPFALRAHLAKHHV